MNTGSILKPFNKMWDAFGRRAIKCFPNATVNTPEICNRIGATLSRPDVNRGIMGATAILSQPLIDYYNPDVDKETAKTSTCRTIGKIVAGTTVGCVVRSLCYYGTKAFTSPDPLAKGWRRALMPSRAYVRYLNGKFPDWIKNYRSGISTIIGLMAMLFTNVLIDVPLTNKITQKMLHVFNLKDNTQAPAPNGTNTNPNNGYTFTPRKDAKETISDAFADFRNSMRGGES